MSFSQKYCIVQFLEPVEPGHVFDSNHWPPHCTLAGVFAIEWTDQLKEKFRETIRRQRVFSSTTNGLDFFGANREVHVKLVQSTDELSGLHDSIVDFIEENNGAFNEPQYQRKGFRPHITLSQAYSVEDGTKVEFNTISLIDMFPDGDHLKRRVIETIPLG